MAIALKIGVGALFLTILGTNFAGPSNHLSSMALPFS